jgi:hypothetical protein
MAKIIYVCLREKKSMPDFPTRLQILSERISPDNIIPNPPTMMRSAGIWVGVINPTSPLLTKNESICLGTPFAAPDDWWKPGGGDPDGTYSMFRSNGIYVELGTDIAATRTIWYALTDQFLVASNSQRAIIGFLGDFQPNRETFTWMLATGVLGPNCSWDSRIKYVEPDSHVMLNRQTWTLSYRERTSEYQPLDLPSSEHRTRLNNTIKGVFSQIDMDATRWVLALSGGLDSRGILVFLKDRAKPETISWGVGSSLNNPLSDVQTAKMVADYFHVPHLVFQLDPESEESGETILNRFIALGEGRMDYLHGYMEGFSIRKTLFEKGVWGIIRGDELMGRPRMYTEHQALARNNIHQFSEFFNLPPVEDLDLPVQRLPESYSRKPGEALSAWEYRIHKTVRMPTAVAAWCEIKTGYSEVMNPLLSRSVDQVFQSIPANLTQDKKLFREIVLEQTPNLPTAKSISIASIEDIFRKRRFIDPVIDELSSANARNYLSSDLIHFIVPRIQLDEKNVSNSLTNSLKQKIKQKFPQILAISSRIPRKDYMDMNKMAFRAYIITKTCQMLTRDAEMFKVPVKDFD